MLPTFLRLRYFFEFSATSPLWSANEAAYARFGYPADLAALPLSAELRADLADACRWFQSSLASSAAPEAFAFSPRPAR
jgi:hypothetical protein